MYCHDKGERKTREMILLYLLLGCKVKNGGWIVKDVKEVVRGKREDRKSLSGDKNGTAEGYMAT